MEVTTSSIVQLGEVKNCRATEDNVEVKGSVFEDSRKIDTLNRNDIAKVLADTNKWYVVESGNDEIGFIEKDKAKAVVKEGQGPQQPLPTRYPERETAPQTQVEEAKDLTAMEEEMISMVNSAREKNGLAPYKIDGELTNVARIKADDMVENNYFSHYSPTYGSPFQMMDHYGIEYLAAGENLAGNQSVESAHNTLMNSSGHRKNILSKEFTHIGVGIKESDKYGYVFVQMFINKIK